MEINEGNTLTKVIKRPPVDIQFTNLSYSIGKKKILKSISGKFNSGHLTGILGTSGAGKTTLLNVLAGQLQRGISGEIYINDEPRMMRKFHKMLSYIMQEDLVQPFLTVLESVTVAANLKLGNEVSKKDKQSVIFEILSVMGLHTCSNTRVENLSGGQRKRLIIALELVNNPPVLFLDEPTTGLDDVAMRHCLQLLKSLTLQGRTIICTIHQPSDSLFKLFDTVYFMSDGYCIYNGSVPDLIPFFTDTGFPCPTNYSPADFIIELVHTQNNNMLALKDKVNNGQTTYNQKYKLSDVKHHNCIDEEVYEQYSSSYDFPTSFWTQFSVLMGRTFLQMRRNKIVLLLQFAHNIICGLLMGWMFYNRGATGDGLIITMKLFYGVVIYLLYTHMMSPILLYPFEIKLLQREYFNRWYSLKAYFTALFFGLLPIMVVPTMIFVGLAYILTGQPLEWHRFIWFTIICLFMAVASQKMGYTIGTIFNPAKGACIGSAVAILLVLLGMYGAGHGDTIEPYMKFLMCLSFPYHTYAGIVTSVLNDRGVLECDSICYFGDPNFMLLKMGMDGTNSRQEAIFLVIFSVVHQLLSYLFLKIRVMPEYSAFRNCLNTRS